MKAIRTVILFLYCLAFQASGGTVVIAWDKTALATSYRVYQGIRFIKSVTGTQATLTLPDSGVHKIGVTACSAAGESAMSEIVVVPLVIEVSDDLGIWRRRTTIYDEVGTRLFYRTPKLSISLTDRNP